MGRAHKAIEENASYPVLPVLIFRSLQQDNPILNEGE